MSVAKLSVSHQNYLRAIWNLGEWSADPVTTSAVAQKVGLRASTVSDALKKLTDVLRRDLDLRIRLTEVHQ